MKIPRQAFQQSAPISLLGDQLFSNPAGLCCPACLYFPGAVLLLFCFFLLKNHLLYPAPTSLPPGSLPSSTLPGKKYLPLSPSEVQLVFSLYFICFPRLAPLSLYCQLDYKPRGAGRGLSTLPGSMTCSSRLSARQCPRLTLRDCENFGQSRIILDVMFLA